MLGKHLKIIEQQRWHAEPAVPKAEVVPECHPHIHFATAEDKGSRLEMEGKNLTAYRV